MKKIVVHNNDNLSKSDINLWMYRSRGIIINSKNEVLLGYLDGTYQFPGGHLENDETIEECLIREVREETGLDIDGKYEAPFYRIVYYDKDYPEDGINRYCEFNYFVVRTDDKFDLDNTKYDDYEIENNYELRYLKIDDFEKTLNSDINTHERNKVIYPEIIDVMRTYLANA